MAVFRVQVDDAQLTAVAALHGTNLASTERYCGPARALQKCGGVTARHALVTGFLAQIGPCYAKTGKFTLLSAPRHKLRGQCESSPPTAHSQS